MSATKELKPAEIPPEPSPEPSAPLPVVDHGRDPGDGETWDIVRLRCPECDRPIALLGDEERFPQHALLPTAWHPFSPAVCAGSGRSVDEALELEDEPDFDPEPSLESLLTLPPELDWRRQPFSHVGGPVPAPRRHR
jgi:hypothetical protein